MTTKGTGGRSWALWLLSVLVVSAVLAGCTPPSPGRDQLTPSLVVTRTVVNDISAVLDEHQDELMRLPGVVGVGVGQDETTGEPIILILMEDLTPDLEKSLPQELGGFSVKPLEVGEIKAE